MKTIRVRIAVAVSHNGAWTAYGCSGATDGEKMGFAIDSTDGSEYRYWLEAALPIPEAVTVEGAVTKAP